MTFFVRCCLLLGGTILILKRNIILGIKNIWTFLFIKIFYNIFINKYKFFRSLRSKSYLSSVGFPLCVNDIIYRSEIVIDINNSSSDTIKSKSWFNSISKWVEGKISYLEYIQQSLNDYCSNYPGECWFVLLLCALILFLLIVLNIYYTTVLITEFIEILNISNNKYIEYIKTHKYLYSFIKILCIILLVFIVLIIFFRWLIIVSMGAQYLANGSMEKAYYVINIGIIIPLLLYSITILIIRIYINKLKNVKVSIFSILVLVFLSVLLVFWVLVGLGFIKNNAIPYTYIITEFLNLSALLSPSFFSINSNSIFSNTNLSPSFSPLSLTRWISGKIPWSITSLSGKSLWSSTSFKGHDRITLIKGKSLAFALLPGKKISFNLFKFSFIKLPDFQLGISKEPRPSNGWREIRPAKPSAIAQLQAAERLKLLNVIEASKLVNPEAKVKNPSKNTLASILSTESTTTKTATNTRTQDINTPTDTGNVSDIVPVNSIIQASELSNLQPGDRFTRQGFKEALYNAFYKNPSEHNYFPLMQLVKKWLNEDYHIIFGNAINICHELKVKVFPATDCKELQMDWAKFVYNLDVYEGKPNIEFADIMKKRNVIPYAEYDKDKVWSRILMYNEPRQLEVMLYEDNHDWFGRIQGVNIALYFIENGNWNRALNVLTAFDDNNKFSINNKEFKDYLTYCNSSIKSNYSFERRAIIKDPKAIAELRCLRNEIIEEIIFKLDSSFDIHSKLLYTRDYVRLNENSIDNKSFRAAFLRDRLKEQAIMKVNLEFDLLIGDDRIISDNNISDFIFHRDSNREFYKKETRSYSPVMDEIKKLNPDVSKLFNPQDRNN